MNGLLAAGGDIINHRDPNGLNLGVTVTRFNGDSGISITAGNQIRLGRDLYAGKNITLSGGIDPVDGTSDNPTWEGYGLVLYGTTHLATSQPNSVIELGGAGHLAVLAPAWTQEVLADGFAEYATGRLTGDATLVLRVNLGTHIVQGTVTLTAAATANNNGLADLAADLEAAILATNFTVTTSVSGSPAVGSTQLLTGLDVRESDGRLLLTSNDAFTVVAAGSANAARLGFTQLASGNAVASRTYTVNAAAEGSVVNFGSTTGANGPVTIDGWIRAYSGINFFNSGSAASLQTLTLGLTGVLETLSGSMDLDLGLDGVLRGTLIARGSGSNITLHAARTLEIYGNLIAQDSIYLTAGDVLAYDTTSIVTYDSSHLLLLDPGGTISIVGLNDVYIKSSIGGGQCRCSGPRPHRRGQCRHLPHRTRIHRRPPRHRPRLRPHRDRRPAQPHRRILEIAGVIISTRATPATNDSEVVLNATESLILSGSLTLAGSLKLASSLDISLNNVRIIVANGQGLSIEAERDLLIGGVAPIAGDSAPTATILQGETRVSLTAGRKLMLGYDSAIFSSGAGSRVELNASQIVVIGGVYAGASYDATAGQVWTGGRGPAGHQRRLLRHRRRPGSRCRLRSRRLRRRPRPRRLRPRDHQRRPRLHRARPLALRPQHHLRRRHGRRRLAGRHPGLGHRRRRGQHPDLRPRRVPRHRFHRQPHQRGPGLHRRPGQGPELPRHRRRPRPPPTASACCSPAWYLMPTPTASPAARSTPLPAASSPSAPTTSSTSPASSASSVARPAPASPMPAGSPSRSGSDVTVAGLVDAGDSISIKGINVYVLQDARVKVRNTGASILFQASNGVYVQAASAAAPRSTALRPPT